MTSRGWFTWALELVPPEMVCDKGVSLSIPYVSGNVSKNAGLEKLDSVTARMNAYATPL